MLTIANSRSLQRATCSRPRLSTSPCSTRPSILAAYTLNPARHTRHIRPVIVKSSNRDDEAERLVKEADQGPGIADSEAFGVVLKVAAVAVVVATFVLLGQLAQPVVDNTIASFPIVASGGADAGVDVQ